MTTVPGRHNLVEKRFILAYSFRGLQPIMFGKAGAAHILVMDRKKREWYGNRLGRIRPQYLPSMTYTFKKAPLSKVSMTSSDSTTVWRQNIGIVIL